ncbi:GNAT family N-acetyltransferase [Sphingobium sp. H39-3-25]|uniref:GNAT family N-acetyltransferase n=1 Tax=Sphingobium arseniciresistens TaxID=3030834 RepID=UPI0023B8E6EA|nr:GNAT family N-acetyltransferase [Sphingobium arseniciresistens]
MAHEPIDQKLRDMAEHRGLKLLRSRKRKPGRGDYGKFGLADAQGNALLGITEEGLTAAPEDIEAYLREGATSTWKASAEAAPEQAVHPPEAGRTENEPDDEPFVRARRDRVATGSVQPRRTTQKKAASTAPKMPASRTSDEREKRANRKKARRTERRSERPYATEDAIHKAQQIPLTLRSAKPSDAADLSALLRQLTAVTTDELAIARNLAHVRKASGGTCVAEKEGIIGCCSWTTVQTLQHGVIGRISLVLVDKCHRRQGVAGAMLDEAYAALRKAGCSRVEAISDIEISNAHNFFRARKFEQTSYRFARDIPSTD